MKLALSLAAEAGENAEVPVGAVLVCADEVVGRGRNSPIAHSDATAHAEILAIREAGRNLANYRLPNTTLYITLEPCAMCAGAIIQARIQRVVFGAYDEKSGAAGSVVNLFNNHKLNHHAEVIGGVMAETSVMLLQNFFRARRAAT